MKEWDTYKSGQAQGETGNSPESKVDVNVEHSTNKDNDTASSRYESSYESREARTEGTESSEHKTTVQATVTHAAPQFEAYYNEIRSAKSPKSSKKKTKMNPALPMMAAFLAGAIMVGGLSYAADRANLFTGGVTAGQSAAGQAAGGYAGQDAGLSTASLNPSENIASVYEQASPAVVKIENYTEVQQQSRRLNDSLFQEFFGGMGGRGGSGQGQEGSRGQSGTQDGNTGTGELQLSGSGTGFFFDKEGYILTNEHVIAGASEVKVTVEGYDEPLTAQVLGASYELDLAVLKVVNPGGGSFPALTLGNSDETAIGDWVLAIGNPYGFDHTLTTGVLSAKERPITIQGEQGEHVYEHLLQTDASINPGNSGGPLLNERGEVIGINTAVNAEAQGIGFAIPTSTILEVLEKLKTNSL
jgi:serine protease Do